MRPEEGVVRKVRRRDEVARLEAEIERARPYLALAHEIRAEVDRVAEQADGNIDVLVDAIDAIPTRERHAVALAVFRQLPADRRWDVLERVFGDGELMAALAVERAALVRIAQARATNALDTRDVPVGEQVTLGLFRERDVRDAIALGQRSGTCARRLVCSATGNDGALRVIEDVFNPSGGYFVTEDYDLDTWSSADRLPPHAIVRAGSITMSAAGATFAPVLHIGGRVDFDRDGAAVEGRLHLGYVMVGDDDVFAEGG